MHPTGGQLQRETQAMMRLAATRNAAFCQSPHHSSLPQQINAKHITRSSGTIRLSNTQYNVGPGLISQSHYSRGDESPLKGDTPLLINQGFMYPGLKLHTLYIQLKHKLLLSPGSGPVGQPSACCWVQFRTVDPKANDMLYRKSSIHNAETALGTF